MSNQLKRYLLTILVCILVVNTFAFVQYQFLQAIPFSFTNYIIPSVVGGLFGFLLAFIKILENKYHIEKDLVVEKNKKIHMYVGTIVHDLRSPISAIYSLVEILQEQNEGQSEETKTYLGLIRTSVESMLENIQLILDNTQFESGKMHAHLEKGNPYYTINSTVDKHIVLAINKSITIQRMIERNLPEVEYDKEMLDRVLSNLISNSIKYSPAQTQIRIYSELLSGRLNLIVKDEGQGLTKDDLDNLFHEFQTLSAKPTGGETATGLGLSVTKKLVEEMGGTICAESEGKGKGSTFKVALPLAPGSEILQDCD
jgi:signal transduction histidine kinase